MKGCVYLILGALMVFSINGWAVDESPADGVRFWWAFAARVTQNGSEKLVRIEKDTPLQTGDQMKMFIKPQSDCYIYLLYLSSAAELMLLYPNDLFDSVSKPGDDHFIPNSSAWFALDDQTGKEKFYLLASKKRLNGLESLLHRHLDKHTGVITDDAAVRAVLAHIKDIKRQNRNFSTAAEKPIRIGGNFRGTQQAQNPTDLRDVTQLAVEITAPEFYSRTFTIDHR
jgi:hypothetical protein